MKRHKHIPKETGTRAVGRTVAAALLATLLLGLPSGSGAAPAPGAIPPQALGYDRQGRALNLGEARGRVVVVTFWASWCTPCLDELAALENLQKRIGGERLLVVAVNWREDLFQYRASLRRLEGVQIRLSRDETEAVAKAYGVDTIPRSFLIGRDGRLAFDNRGFESPQDVARLARQIASLLAELGEPSPHAIIAP